MIRSSTLTTSFAALAAAALTIGVSVPAAAQTTGYRAVPVTPAKAGARIVVGETLWVCGTDACTAAKSTSRPAIVCEQAAKKVGKLTSFTAGETAFDDAALTKCNAKAKA
jgi:hypothetical protein